MSERLTDIEARIRSVEQLSSVIEAMRGMAAARAQEASHHLAGVQAYAATIAAAIGRVAPSRQTPATARWRKGSHLVVALCAEQGFAGGFSRRILDRFVRLRNDSQDQAVKLLLIGDRGLLAALERDLQPSWSAPMISATAEAASLSNHIMEEIYERIGKGPVERVSLLYAHPGGAMADIIERQIIPFDASQLDRPAGRTPPLLHLSPETLFESLAEEYVFAEICEAVVLSYAAENETRMRAMMSAERNVSETLETLTASARRQRQEEISNEISELSTSILSSASA
ncbi:F0F1 ATP synthase subunit gamma [Rhizobium straminoryzae]|uniref:F0F1 ATP synthase subunit gamma n=1 Tax=Rhizobium straminoryzae TaxID=1387186 RepID=A0A549THV6_9HYPH|nr:FoF1 ATP synthase subunit gamma [Rhizobium straminoryzae]TRL42690.1 hypothetical protein FNA46_01510 [Rhizobium straminoryzae]